MVLQIYSFFRVTFLSLFNKRDIYFSVIVPAYFVKEKNFAIWNNFPPNVTATINSKFAAKHLLL